MAFSVSNCILHIFNLFSTSIITFSLIHFSFFSSLISLLSSSYPSSPSTFLISSFLLPSVYLAPFLFPSTSTSSSPIYKDHSLSTLSSQVRQSPSIKHHPFFNISTNNFKLNNYNLTNEETHHVKNTSFNKYISTTFKNSKANKSNSGNYNKDILTFLKPSYFKNGSFPFFLQNDHPSIQRQKGRRLIGRLHPSRRLSRITKRKNKYRKRLLLNMRERQQQRYKKPRVIKNYKSNKKVNKNAINKLNRRNINAGRHSILKDFLRYNKHRNKHAYLSSREAKLRKKNLRRSFTQSLNHKALDQAVDVVADSQYQLNYPIKVSTTKYHDGEKDYKTGKNNTNFNINIQNNDRNNNIKSNNVNDFDDHVHKTNLKCKGNKMKNGSICYHVNHRRKVQNGYTNEKDNHSPVYINKEKNKKRILQVLNEKTNNKIYINNKNKYDKNIDKNGKNEDTINFKASRYKPKESEYIKKSLSRNNFTKYKRFHKHNEHRSQSNLSSYRLTKRKNENTKHHKDKKENTKHHKDNQIKSRYKHSNDRKNNLNNYHLTVNHHIDINHKNNYKHLNGFYSGHNNYTKLIKDKIRNDENDKKNLDNPLNQLKVHSSTVFQTKLVDLNGETCNVQASTQQIKEPGCRRTHVKTKSVFSF